MRYTIIHIMHFIYEEINIEYVFLKIVHYHKWRKSEGKSGSFLKIKSRYDTKYIYIQQAHKSTQQILIAWEDDVWNLLFAIFGFSHEVSQVGFMKPWKRENQA